MPKKQYIQNFRASWQKIPDFEGWLQPVSNDITKAYCKYCKCELIARVADLKKHCTREKHIALSKPFSSNRQKKITFKARKKTINKIKQSEGQLALYCATHGNMNVSDHLCLLCNSLFADSEAAQIRMHRTKCTQIITNVLGPHFRRSLHQDVGEKKFSLILDESTDISTIKFLGIVIRYYSEEAAKIVSTFVELVELSSGTAEGIIEGIEKVANNFGLDLKYLIGIGTDNASVMTGINQGVYTLLKIKYNLPNLVLIRCVCHSLQLAVSHATEETLPRNLEFLIRETYNWFSNSTLRQSAYREIYSLINDGEMPLKIPQVSNTRWISIEAAIKQILRQWLELKTHFSMVRHKENCYTAELLYSNYTDDKNKVYLTYIYQILNEVQRTNKAFESESVDPTKLLQDLKNLMKSITSKILIPSARIEIYADNIEQHLDPNPYLGYAYENALREASNITEQERRVLKDRCIQFTVKLCKELQKRLPSNLTLLELMHLLHCSEAMKIKQHKRSITDLAKQFLTDPKIITDVENQWYNLANVKWENANSSEKLWNEIYRYQDSCGENPFKDLAELALTVLSLPYSNAEVERVFSQMNVVKSKLRNRLKVKTINATLTVRYGLKRIEKCCNSYTLPQDVINVIGTLGAYDASYSGPTVNNSESNELNDEEECLMV